MSGTLQKITLDTIDYLLFNRDASVECGLLSVLEDKGLHCDNANDYLAYSFATKEIVLDKTQNFTKGWIRAKAPFGYSITSIKPDRSRLEVIDKSLDSCVVLNGLGADIEYICYCSSVDDKSILTGENIIAGKKGQLKIPQSIKRNDAYSPVYAKKFLEKDMTKKVLKDYIDTYALEKLKPGEYVAVLKTNPFMKQGFDWRGNIREYACIVHGMPN